MERKYIEIFDKKGNKRLSMFSSTMIVNDGGIIKFYASDLSVAPIAFYLSNQCYHTEDGERIDKVKTKLDILADIILKYKSNELSYMECLRQIYLLEREDNLNYRIFCDMFEDSITNNKGEFSHE